MESSSDCEPGAVPSSPRQGVTAFQAVLLLALGAAGAFLWHHREVAFGDDSPTVLFLLMQEPPTLLPHERNPLVREEFEPFRQSQAALICSRSNIQQAIQALGKSTDFNASEWAKDATEIQGHLRTSLAGPQHLQVKLNLPGRSRAESVRVLNAICEAHVDSFHEEERSRALARLAQLETTLYKLSEQERRSRVMLQGLIEKLGNSQETDALNQSFQATSDELRRLRFELSRKEAELQYLTAHAEESLDSPSAMDDAHDPVVESLLSRRLALQMTVTGQQAPSAEEEYATRAAWQRESEVVEESLLRRRRARRAAERQQLQREIAVGRVVIGRVEIEVSRLRNEVSAAALKNAPVELHMLEIEIEQLAQVREEVAMELNRLRVELDVERPPYASRLVLLTLAE